MKPSILIVAAHPDDEALGCGGSIARWAQEGHPVHTLFLTNGVGARGSDAGATQRHAALEEASRLLGVASHTRLDLPDNQLDSLPLLTVVQAVEQHMRPLAPAIVVTHHAHDLNIDHRICHQAVMTACRPQPGFGVTKILAFETMSSTEWQTPAPATAFVPQLFVDITATIDRKQAALAAYSEEMRPFPHARSWEAVEALATYRGASVGVARAEAFMLVREIA